MVVVVVRRDDVVATLRISDNKYGQVSKMGLKMRGLGLRLLRQMRMSARLIWPVSSRRFGGLLSGERIGWGRQRFFNLVS